MQGLACGDKISVPAGSRAPEGVAMRDPRPGPVPRVGEHTPPASGSPVYPRPRTTSTPEWISATSSSSRWPLRSERIPRSTATIWETFATESFGSPVRSAGSVTFPGAAAHRRLLVSGTTTTVPRRLALNASPWTTTTGRRKPGPEPAISRARWNEEDLTGSPPPATRVRQAAGGGEPVAACPS